MKKWIGKVALVLGALLMLAIPAQAVDYTWELLAPPIPEGATSYSTTFYGVSPDTIVGAFDAYFPSPIPRTKESLIYRDGVFELSSDPVLWYDVSNNGLNMVGPGTIVINGVSKIIQSGLGTPFGVNDNSTVVGWRRGDHTSGTGCGTIAEDNYGSYNSTICYRHLDRMTMFFDIADDSETVFGSSWLEPRTTTYFIYNATTHEIQVLPEHPGFDRTLYTGMSPDGSLFVGRVDTELEGPVGIFTYDGSEFGFIPFPDLPGIPYMWPQAISNSGRIVGQAASVDGNLGFIATPFVSIPPEEFSVNVKRYHLVYDQERLSGIMKLGAGVELLPDTITTLPDGSVIQSVTITVVFPGLGEGGVDLVFIDQFDMVVTSKPGVLKLKQAE